MKPIEFWFSIGSTYSYLTIARLEQVQRDTGAEFTFRPFSVREIMVEMDNVPFAKKPVKAAYMWRDIERRADRYGLSPRLPATYPLAQFDLVNRIAVLAAREGWVWPYLKASYLAWFEQGQPAGEPENLAQALGTAGQDMKQVLVAANGDAVGTAYAEATQAARERGIFGAPSFVCSDNELFWGDDRLEEAIAWQRALG